MTRKMFLTVAVLAGLSGLAPAQAPQTSNVPKGGQNVSRDVREQQQIASLKSQIQQLNQQLRPSWDQLRQFREKEDAALNSSSVDKTAGIAKIPIEVAKKKLLEHGLPTRPQGGASAAPAKSAPAKSAPAK